MLYLVDGDYGCCISVYEGKSAAQYDSQASHCMDTAALSKLKKLQPHLPDSNLLSSAS